MEYRKYDPERDKEAVHRIWHEVGWISKATSERMDYIIEHSGTIVADIDGQPECLVTSLTGDIDYLGKRLKFAGISGVTTSLIARKQKLAARLTATRIALDAVDGAIVSGLGMFEQGYYNKLGYGTCRYEHIIRFSPASLNIDLTPRVPKRLSKDDYAIVHQSRLKRLRTHGSCSFYISGITKSDMHHNPSCFGFGYFDDNGELTHNIWMTGLGKEYGPFSVLWMTYRNYSQFKELLALLQSFGDQVQLVRMLEPPNVQMQDFIKKPFHYMKVTADSPYQNAVKALAFEQLRICNLEECLSATNLNCEDIRFNLELNDPIEKYLDDNIDWKGISGNYIVKLGSESFAEKGNDKKLPVLKASVGAFSRMWMGILPASILAVSDDLRAPQELLDKLDKAFNLPVPAFDWEF